MADNAEDIFLEIIQKLPVIEDKPYKICYHKEDNYNRVFNYGCDALIKMVDEEMAVKNY